MLELVSQVCFVSMKSKQASELDDLQGQRQSHFRACRALAMPKWRSRLEGRARQRGVLFPTQA